MQEWRMENQKFQEKTDGGVYFWSNPNPIWGCIIDKSVYNSLPKYAKRAVLMVSVSHTGDGNHYDIYFVNKNGEVDWIDEYGKEDFLYAVRSCKSDMGDMNGYKAKWNQIGDKLERKDGLK